MFKYKIEEWDREHGGTTFYVAFVRSGWVSWCELGRVDTKAEAEELCRRHEQPPRKPWYYTAETIMQGDNGL